jgi:uncharacterized protein (DUF305 family)
VRGATRTSTPAAVVVAVAMVLAGCAGEDPTSDGGPDDSPAGMHGDHAGPDALPGVEVSAPPEDANWNAADAAYLTRMVAHHSQALDMTELAPTRAGDPRVRRLARSIDVGQRREVVVMATWLVDHGQPEPTLETVAAVHHQGMPGMVGDDRLAALAEADGAAFDRLFLEAMVQHHQGAVAMAEQVLGDGEDQRVDEMATEVIASQQAEVAIMRRLLADLP